MLVCSYLVIFFPFFSHFFQDLSPYLGAVVPGLKQALLDPVPEVVTIGNLVCLLLKPLVLTLPYSSVRCVQFLPAPSVPWSAVWVRRVLRICYLG